MASTRAAADLLAWPVLSCVFTAVVYLTSSRRAGLAAKLAVPIWMLTFLLQSYAACEALANESFENYVHYWFSIAISLFLLICWYALIDTGSRLVHSLVVVQTHFERKSKVCQGQTRIMESLCTHGRPETDAAYSFNIRHSAAEVLEQVWWVLASLMAGVGTFMFVIVYVQASSSAESSDSMTFDFSFLTLTLGLFSSAVLSFVGISPSAFSSLMHITLSKPFYVGDLITIFKDTSEPTGYSGFVENFTFKSVVIRGFDNKQIWITHEAFSSLSISNWTRRPGKAIKMKVLPKLTSDPDDVQTLALYIRAWLKAADGVEQSKYQKAHVARLEEGFTINVICHCTVGTSSKKVKERLTADIAKAAQRLGITLVPKAHAHGADNYATVGSDRPEDATRVLLDDLKRALPLPERGFADKGSKGSSRASAHNRTSARPASEPPEAPASTLTVPRDLTSVLEKDDQLAPEADA